MCHVLLWLAGCAHGGPPVRAGRAQLGAGRPACFCAATQPGSARPGPGALQVAEHPTERRRRPKEPIIVLLVVVWRDMHQHSKARRRFVGPSPPDPTHNGPSRRTQLRGLDEDEAIYQREKRRQEEEEQQEAMLTRRANERTVYSTPGMAYTPQVGDAIHRAGG